MTAGYGAFALSRKVQLTEGLQNKSETIHKWKKAAILYYEGKYSKYQGWIQCCIYAIIQFTILKDK